MWQQHISQHQIHKAPGSKCFGPSVRLLELTSSTYSSKNELLLNLWYAAQISEACESLPLKWSMHSCTKMCGWPTSGSLQSATLSLLLCWRQIISIQFNRGVMNIKAFTNIHHLFCISPGYFIYAVRSILQCICSKLTVHIFTVRFLSVPVDIKSPQSHGPGLRSLPETPSRSSSPLHFNFNNIAAFWKGTSTLCVNLW